MKSWLRRMRPLLLFAMLTVALGAACPRAEAGPSGLDRDRILEELGSDDPAVEERALAALVEDGDPALLGELEAWRETGDRRTRVLLKPAIDLLRNRARLTSETVEERRSAATDLGSQGRRVAVPWLEQAVEREPDRWVRYAMQESLGLLKLRSQDPGEQLQAVEALGELRSQNGLPALKELLQQTAAGEGAGTAVAPEVLRAARAAVQKIETWSSWTGAIETIFRGISLSSILLLMALGLAIIFGLMGVINMAHGELMMLGAYATFLTQELFKAYLPETAFDAYFLVALPASFVAAALFGLLLEAALIRHLYGRPLETLLATWGVSLIMIQGARVIFGDLTSVTAPRWLSGGAQVLVGVQLPYNRLFIIALAAICVVGLYVVLFRSSVGLRVRAVMQNRSMSACLGIPTRKVDAYTFAFGSGLAGLAGCALTLVGNVEPGLGQNYIVDSFMVVVTGGVGKLAGTIVAALGIGSLNKLLEPSFGAVYGKVLILLLVILFLQRRPSGLFSIKGRHAEA